MKLHVISLDTPQFAFSPNAQNIAIQCIDAIKTPTSTLIPSFDLIQPVDLTVFLFLESNKSYSSYIGVIAIDYDHLGKCCIRWNDFLSTPLERSKKLISMQSTIRTGHLISMSSIANWIWSYVRLNGTLANLAKNRRSSDIQHKLVPIPYKNNANPKK